MTSTPLYDELFDGLSDPVAHHLDPWSYLLRYVTLNGPMPLTVSGEIGPFGALPIYTSPLLPKGRAFVTGGGGRALHAVLHWSG